MAEQTNKTVLGPDCRISGELALDNDAVIMGQFKGTLRVTGMLEIADSAEVSGTIIVGTLRLAGHAEADVIAEDGVELLPGSQLIGQLYTSQLNVVEGATFQGDVCVGPKAIEAATEALSLEDQPVAKPQAQPKPARQPEPVAAQPEEADDAEMAEDDGTSAVHTVPGSVNQILQRRRAKVLSTRQAA
jgi:cytoskeletal protein CcmA (bactofilin family)